ncbi:MAG: hypothetical protein K2M72_05190 [Paramuribaculum sp.]|nr:hypothetical protein [Paramuribaculum sp.]MDE7449591.1 hypothetical protein [Paramuribaculum sp.]
MKKTFPILLLFAASALYTSASEFGFLTFTTNDGGTTSIPAESLEIRYSDGMLTAQSGETTLTLPTASLVKMEFTEEATTNVADLIGADISGKIQVYTLDGIVLGTFNSIEDIISGLSKGNYILIINGKAIKIAL